MTVRQGKGTEGVGSRVEGKRARKVIPKCGHDQDTMYTCMEKSQWSILTWTTLYVLIVMKESKNEK